MTLPSCPVTAPNGSTPPGERPSAAHHGNGALWTALGWPGGRIPVSAPYLQPDGAVRMKFPWWRGSSARGPLAIEGRRLDADAPPLRAHLPAGYGDAFQASALFFPTEGCWRVTGASGGATLTFVVIVGGCDRC